jgi:hypothetical protein
MRTITQSHFNELLQESAIKAKVKTELKFVRSVADLGDWSIYELVGISDRTGDKGVLLVQPYEELYLVEYAISRRIIDYNTGRGRAIICDFCYTWQPGSNAASITFTHATTKHKVSFLCCGDLLCSRHVRSLTPAALVSRSQLREDMSNEDRVARLKDRLLVKIRQLELTAVSAPPATD